MKQNNYKFRVAHLHTDTKFLKGSDQYSNEYFNNTLYFIKSKSEIKRIQETDSIIEYKDVLFEKLIIELNKFELIILWGLSATNQEIALSLNKTVIIFWRFFGYELYNRIPQILYSKKTLKTFTLKQMLAKTRIGSCFCFLIKRNNRKIFLNSLKRINYFIGISKMEYDYLKIYFPTLPTFIFLPIVKPDTHFNFSKNKTSNIIIGHNAHRINNHLDIIDYLIENKQKSESLNFIMLMNYGLDNSYKRIILNRTAEIVNLSIMEEMLTYNDFLRFYKGISAFVLNSYRQCGMGNIYIGLKSGVKIYLNKNNVMFNWLKSEGFLIFSIDDFRSDLSNDNLVLSERDAYYNFENYLQFAEKYSVQKFQKKIIDIMRAFLQVD